MRKLWPVLLLAGVVAVAAYADEYNQNGTIVRGTGVQSATGLNTDDSYAIQCPNIDGGSGQKVFYRPGGCSGCPTDAGLGDVLIDFTSNQDPYPVRLRPDMTKIHLRAYVETHDLFCIVAPKSRP